MKRSNWIDEQVLLISILRWKKVFLRVIILETCDLVLVKIRTKIQWLTRRSQKNKKYSLDIWPNRIVLVQTYICLTKFIKHVHIINLEHNNSKWLEFWMYKLHRDSALFRLMTRILYLFHTSNQLFVFWIYYFIYTWSREVHWVVCSFQ